MRRRVSRAAGLRAHLIEQWQRVADPFERYFTEPRLAALQAGEPVVVSDWELPVEHRPHVPLEERGRRHYQLEADDSLRPWP